jgi:effector-binding domain-containing protein
MNTKKHYYWDEDTINQLQFLSSYTSVEEVYNEIQEFVENNCEIQENEVEQDLIDDLVRQVGL